MRLFLEKTSVTVDKKTNRTDVLSCFIVMSLKTSVSFNIFNGCRNTRLALILRIYFNRFLLLIMAIRV
jgi:hypothetical protein